MAKTDTYGQQAQILSDDADKRVSVEAASRPEGDKKQGLVAWVTSRLQSWRDHRQSNYEHMWDEYERLWRGIYSSQEKQRKSERSKIIVPALSEAVENSVAEIEEAIFGRGDFFDITPEFDDNETMAAVVEKNKLALKEDLNRGRFPVNVSEVLINGAVFGTGIGEIIVKKFTKRDVVVAMEEAMAAMGEPAAPAAPDMSPLDMALKQAGLQPGQIEQPAPVEGGAPGFEQLIGGMPGETAKPSVEQMQEEIAKEVAYACLRSVNPRNFLIDPNARSIEDALGVAIEEYVNADLIKQGIEDGTYMTVELKPGGQSDSQLTADPQMVAQYESGNVHVYRYYGRVPKHLLDAAKNGETGSEEPGTVEMVEACVFIVHGTDVLKAEANPYFMKDRSVVAFQWDMVPGRFWGRGICEKGATPQKLLDAEFRSRMDALAFSAAPMMGMDASRLPRGFTFKIFPGASILTNGKPSDVLAPMQFGQVDQNTYQQAQALDQMVQRATGSLDGVGMAQQGVSGQARSGAVSMSMAGIVKRHRRTLINFIDNFMAPALEKIMWRNMQFYPERYEPLNFTFNVSGTMGIMQREYESQTLVQMLQALPPESPAHKIVIKAIIQQTGLANRADIIKELEAPPPQVDPQMAALQQQAAQAQLQLEIAEKQAKIAQLNAQAAELNSRAALNQAKTQTELVEPELRANEIMMKGIYNTPEDQMAAEFDRRLAAAELVLRQEDIASNERIAAMQTHGKVAETRIKAEADRTKAAATVEAAKQKPAPKSAQ